MSVPDLGDGKRKSKDSAFSLFVYGGFVSWEAVMRMRGMVIAYL